MFKNSSGKSKERNKEHKVRTKREAVYLDPNAKPFKYTFINQVLCFIIYSGMTDYIENPKDIQNITWRNL